MTNGAKRILIVEDNVLLADVLRLNLQRAGFEIAVALNGALAVEMLQEDSFDLVITDYQMPQIDGGELCQIIREDLNLHQLPILMCTAKGLEMDTENLKSERGIAHIVFKPFSMREIVQFARSVTDREVVSSDA